VDEDGGEPLAVRLARAYQRCSPGLSLGAALLELVIAPLLDVTLALVGQGLFHETHSQNIVFDIDADAGTTRVVLRDMHGMNYNAEERTRRGGADLFALAALRDDFPALAQTDLDRWFYDGDALFERFRVPHAPLQTIDFFVAIFLFQLLDGIHHSGALDRSDIDALITAIRRHVAAGVRRYNVDTAAWPPPSGDFWSLTSIHGTALFR
jgi:hypothetical protein